MQLIFTRIFIFVNIEFIRKNLESKNEFESQRLMRLEQIKIYGGPSMEIIEWS